MKDFIKRPNFILAHSGEGDGWTVESTPGERRLAPALRSPWEHRTPNPSERRIPRFAGLNRTG